MTERSKVLEKSIDQQGQYSRRNCLLIHSVEENRNEDTDKLVLNIKNDLEIELTEVAIDRTQLIVLGTQKRRGKRFVLQLQNLPGIMTGKKCSLRRNI